MDGFVARIEEIPSDVAPTFRFYCDRCEQPHDQSAPGSFADRLKKMAARRLRHAVPSVGDLVDDVRANHPPATPELAAAATRARVLFSECPGCAKWVCRERCWNAAAGRCIGCVPRHDDAVAVRAAREILAREETAKKTRDSLYDRGSVERHLKGQEVLGRACPACGAEGKKGAFCNACGAPLLGPMPMECATCGIENEPGSKFCSGCGAALG